MGKSMSCKCYQERDENSIIIDTITGVIAKPGFVGSQNICLTYSQTLKI